MAKDIDSAAKSMPLSTQMRATQPGIDASSPEIITTVTYRLEGLEGTRTIIVHRLTSLNGVISLLLLLWGAVALRYPRRAERFWHAVLNGGSTPPSAARTDLGD